MSKFRSYLILVFLSSTFTLFPECISGQESSWNTLKSEILADWDRLLEKYQSELTAKNTFTTSGTISGEPITITYRIKGRLKSRKFDSEKESTFIAYNPDYSFMLIKSSDGQWQLESIKLSQVTDHKGTIRFPEVEQDLMGGDMNMLRKSIENAIAPTIQNDPKTNRIRVVFDSRDDTSLEHAEIELTIVDGHYLPARYIRRAANGEASVHEFEWQISPSGLPTCVATTINSGNVQGKTESPRFDPDLSDREFYVSNYGFSEPSLPSETSTTWWLLAFVIAGMGVACAGIYLKSRQTRS
jgi:hypothetical protein